MDDDERHELREALRRRSRSIRGHGFPDAAAELARLAAWCEAQGLEPDVYGAGAVVEELEARVAALLGYAAARFLPSGTMAQAIAMRLACGAGGHFGMHPTCHLELHEQRGYAHLLGLSATLVGPAERPMLAADLAGVSEPLGALIVELPTRENGGQLPSFDQLTELCALARERGTHTHLDGARLWEAQAAYGRPFGELCALFDSTYVSFYKGIGALSGAMLLGSDEFVEEAHVWQRRMGGNLVTQVASVASAASLLEERLARFPAYLEHARSLAAALARIEGLAVLPDPPQTNLFHVLLDLDPESAPAARDRVAEETGLWLFGHVGGMDEPGRSRFELYVGEATLDAGVAAVEAAFRSLLAG